MRRFSAIMSTRQESGDKDERIVMDSFENRRREAPRNSSPSRLTTRKCDGKRGPSGIACLSLVRSPLWWRLECRCAQYSMQLVVPFSDHCPGSLVYAHSRLPLDGGMPLAEECAIRCSQRSQKAVHFP